MEFPLPTAFEGWRNQVIAKDRTSHVLKYLVSGASFLPPSTSVDVNTNADIYTSLPDTLSLAIFG